MNVYVDAMIDYGKRIGHAGPRWCHMIADTLDELHAMAARIGLRRSWFQNPSSGAHYDIGTERIRALAVAAGAVECDRNAFVGHSRRLRGLPPIGSVKP
jgi:hypothetical protein